MPNGSVGRHAFGSRGFTLIELVVTLVIIGVVAAFGAPLFFSTQSFQQDSFYNETLAAVRYAQKFAVSSGCAVQVSFSGSSYSLSRPAGTATCNTGPYNQPVVDPADSVSTFARTAPSGVSVSTNPVSATFVFCPAGDTSSANCTGVYTNVDVSVTVGGQTFTVTGVTGHVG